MRWFLVCFLLVSFSLHAETLFVSLEGYVSSDEIQEIVADVDAKKPTKMAISLQSSGGDINAVLGLAKRLYAERVQRGLSIGVYIHEQALGPVAILPFLADEIDISTFVSWGDIPLGSEDVVPINILRNQVRSLILGSDTKAQFLRLLADAMTDESLIVVDDGGWRAGTKEGMQEEKVISGDTSTLVVNHQQLQQLGLVAEVLSPAEFRQKMGVEVEERKEESLAEAITPEALQKQLERYIPYQEEGSHIIGRIAIDDRKGMINQSTWLYVKQALDFYKEKKPLFIILELNTPGGEVFAAQEISSALDNFDTQYKIPVVCFINNWAISAGAMLAYSCRFITCVKDASMGAAEPVIMGTEGTKEASEKITSALRTDFANRARFFDRNALIAEAMVDKDLVLVWRNGQVVQLNSDEQIRSKGPNPDSVITRKGKLLTLHAEKMIQFGVADILLQPAALDSITTEEYAKGEWPAEKSLLFTYPYFQAIPNAKVVMYQMDWKTRFFVLISLPAVQSMLFLAMILGAYIEMNTPGFGIPGSIALLCLFLILLASFSLQIAHWLEAIFLLVGLLLILAELFILPTFGLLGIVGGILFIVGLFGIMIPGISSIDFQWDTQRFNAAGEYFFMRLAWLAGTLVVSVILIALLARFVMPSFSGFRRFVLQGHEQEAKEGYVSGVAPATLPPPGTTGRVVATLRPAGKVVIGDTIYDAVTDGAFLEKGSSMVVKRLDGSVLVVGLEEENV